jgi:hypothetical protein
MGKRTEATVRANIVRAVMEGIVEVTRFAVGLLKMVESFGRD